MTRVAPYAGAWIEIIKPRLTNNLVASHPTRVRGLKFTPRRICSFFAFVAPYAGAWIEI